MATTHLTDHEAASLNITDLIRRVRAGEEIHIEDGLHPAVIVKPAEPLDHSMEATIARLEAREKELGYPLRMGADFADDLEKIIALRKPRDTSVWD